jgi:hypothetical protein
LKLQKTVTVWAYVMAHKDEFAQVAYDSRGNAPLALADPAPVTLWTGSPNLSSKSSSCRA